MNKFMPLKKILYCLSFLLIALLANPIFGRGNPDYVTITLPEDILRQSIEDTLPLSLEAGKEMLEGTLVLDTVDRFVLGKNSASLHGLLLGRNLVVKTRIGNQDLKLKLGEMRLPFSCEFSFRFDPVKKNLYITPHLNDSLKEAPPDQASKILPVLVLVNNREYPVSFESMQKFQAKIGGRQLLIEMEPIDIQVVPNKLILKMMPKISKTN